jgi:molecular chaperone GrpE
MSDPRDPSPIEPENGAQPEAGAVGGEPTRDLHSVIEALNAENAQLKDRALRALAEVENVRRRTEKDMADARAYAVSNFARDILTVGDNLRRALESVGEAARSGADASFRALVDGVELTERDLHKTLERHGIKRLDPKGERFDPHLHQAMFEVADPSLPAGTVAQVVASGFTIGDRVLRPAMVGVAKGGPRPVADAPTGAGGTGRATDRSV